MNEIEIANIINKNKFIKNQYQGCFAIDELKSVKIGKNKFILINTCARVKHSQFCHWVTIVNFKNFYYYFDSFSYLHTFHLKPIREYLQEANSKIIFTTQQIQHQNSNLCALFCLSFASAILCKIKIDHFFLLFFTKNKNLHLNDIIVKILIQYFFPSITQK
jgi:hypothetical protein